MTWQSDMGMPDDWQPPGYQPLDPNQADPSRGTNVSMPGGAMRHFDAVQDANGNWVVPKTFISDSIPGGWGAAMPNTDEYSHYGRVLRTDRNRSIGEMLAIAAGAGALGGAFGGAGVGAGAEGVGDVGGVTSFTGGIGGDVAGMLEPISTGASFLPEVVGSGIPYLGAAEAAGLSTGALGSIPALAGAEAGGGALAGIAPSGLPSGVAGYTPAGAGLASGEAASVTPATTGLMGNLGNMVKGAFVNPDGSYNWANIIKAGGTALGAVGAYHNSQNPGTPALPAGWNDHLAPTPLNRHVVGLGNDAAYKTYGQSGGEHQFFQPGPAPADDPGPNVHLNDPTGGAVMRAGGHYIKGPGTGRSDEIDAKLSNDEYVMDAETVALLGDGSPEAGAKKLDQLRANIRKHKGQQLAKGKFSANAKQPEEYLPMRKAKGGVVLRAVPKVPVANDMRAARLAAVQRFRDAIKGQMQPIAPVTEPIRKAEGGAIKAMNAFAEDLEREVLAKNPQRVAQLKSQMDGIMPGAGKYFEEGFAKGGKVKGLVESFGRFFNPPIEGTMPPKVALSPEEMQWMVRWLQQHNPNSDALKHFENASTPDLRGRIPGAPPPAAPEDVMKILGQE